MRPTTRPKPISGCRASSASRMKAWETSLLSSGGFYKSSSCPLAVARLFGYPDSSLGRDLRACLSREGRHPQVRLAEPALAAPTCVQCWSCKHESIKAEQERAPKACREARQLVLWSWQWVDKDAQTELMQEWLVYCCGARWRKHLAAIHDCVSGQYMRRFTVTF